MSCRLPTADRRLCPDVQSLNRLAVVWLLVICGGCGGEADSSAVLAQKVYMHEDRGEYEQAIDAI